MESPDHAKEREAGLPARDSEAPHKVNVHSTATAISDLLEQDNLTAQETTEPASQPLDADPGAGNSHRSAEDQPQSHEGAPLPGGGLFGLAIPSGRRAASHAR